MIKQYSDTLIVTLFSLLFAGPAFGQTGSWRLSGKQKAKVDLVSSVKGVVPGQAFEVAVRFRLARGWHIYWQNSGESGLPPRVTWTLPDGLSAGDLQFPVPKRHADAGGLVTTNILEGGPILLASIAASDSIAYKRAALVAKVTYLICREQCLREQADLRLELPVQLASTAAAPANLDVFERARRALPSLTSQYVSITPRVTSTQLLPGQNFDLLLDVDIARGHVVPSHEPISHAFAKFDVFVERTPGIYFGDAVYPDPNLRKNGTLGTASEYAGRLTVRIPGEVEDDGPGAPVRLGGVLTFQPCNEGGRNCSAPEAVAFSLDVGRQAGSSVGAAATEQEAGPRARAPATSGEGPSGFPDRLGLVGQLVLCFLYGLFINATPCVLPVLSIKVLGFVQQAHESRHRTLMLGLVFGLGVMLFFVILGFLAAAGKNVLQYPAAVIGLGAVVMALALSMLGVYTLQVPTTATKLEANIRREGMFASFGKGALAPVLGFACTGPLLAGAFGWATQQPAHIAVLAFLFAGLGMASPYMLLGANPNWLSFLPKPGPWMITFERIMGFLLLGMVIWLLSPLVPQIGAEGLEWTLAFLVAIGMACWLLGRIDFSMSPAVRWRYRGGAAAIALAAGIAVYGWIYPLGSPHRGRAIPWRTWSAAAVEDAVRSGNIAFVDFTAAWCTVCKVNKKLAINTSEVRDRMETCGVVPFKGDYTSEDPSIAATMQAHGRAGPPLNLIYAAGRPDKPIVLRPNLTKRYLLEKLNEVCPDLAGAASRAGS